jgi:2'-5' RNA ligase superfamily
MVHSIELLLDADSDAAVRRIWAKLADAELPSQAANKSPSNRPHISLVVAERIDADVDILLRATAQRLPIRCVIGAPLVFGGPRFTVARLVVPSAELLSLQADAHDACLPHLVPGPMAHTAPGAWTPHVTLCRRMDPTQLAKALTVVKKLTRDIRGEFVGMRHWDGNKRVERPIRIG